MIMDRWETVKGHDDYEINLRKQVRKKKTGKIMKPNRDLKFERVRVDGKLRATNRLFFDTFDEILEQERKENLRNQIRVVRCRDCIHRYDFDVCEGKDDDFYCGYGER